jgi:hypothetical protein
MKKVIMTDEEQQFSDLKQLFTKIVTKNKNPDQAPNLFSLFSKSQMKCRKTLSSSTKVPDPIHFTARGQMPHWTRM